MTIYSTPHSAIAVAVLTGSLTSNGGGARDVFTEQNMHPLVHVSPMIIIVAVATPLSPPPQHSPMFGHRASSQTLSNAQTK